MMALPAIGEEIDINALAGKTLPAVGEEIDLGMFTPVPPPEAEAPPVTPAAPSRAPWYTLQGVNERLAPTDPLDPRLSRTEAVMALPMNASKQALRTIFGMAGEARTGGPIGAITQPIKGVIDSIAGVPSAEREMVSEELDKRGIGGDMSQSAGERYRKAGNTLLQEPLTPAIDYGIVKGMAKGAPRAVDYLAKKGYERWTAPPVETLEYKIAARVKEGVNKGIRPSVFGRGNSQKLAASEARAVDAVTAIIENKQNLKLTQADGTIAEGALPSGKNAARQSLEALQQTKSAIWKKVNTMLADAGKGGIQIDASPLASTLESAAKNPALDISPQAKTLLLDRAAALKGKKYSLATVEEMIENINAENKAYHKSNNPADTQPAAVKEVIAQYLRQELDKSVESVSGAGFQELKNTYGSLSSIEKDLANRVIVSGRAAPVSMFDHFTTLGTGAEVARAMFTADPVSLARAGVFEGVKAYTKRKNNPNHTIESMFADTDKLMSKRPQKSLGVNPEIRKLPEANKFEDLQAESKVKAAADQKAWAADKERSRLAAEAASRANEAGVKKIAAEREAASGDAVVERNRAAAEQAADRAAKRASDAKIAAETERSAAEIKRTAAEREALTIDRTLEGIPAERKVSIGGLTADGKKFSYKENARAAYRDSKTALDSLDRISSDLYEGEGSLLRTIKKHNLDPAIKADILKRAKVYIDDGLLDKADAGIAAVTDVLAEWNKTHKSILSQLGVEDAVAGGTKTMPRKAPEGRAGRPEGDFTAGPKGDAFVGENHTPTYYLKHLKKLGAPEDLLSLAEEVVKGKKKYKRGDLGFDERGNGQEYVWDGNRLYLHEVWDDGFRRIEFDPSNGFIDFEATP